MNPIKTLQARIGVLDDGNFGPKSFAAFCSFFKISPIQAAHILGQCEHETGGFKIWEENLNYAYKRLLEVWPNRFSEDSARDMERNPEAIANFVYSSRMGNVEPGDGWKFRGRGATQLTGRSNYQKFADSIKDQSIMSDPDQVADKYAFDSALFFFKPLLTLMVDGSTRSIITVTKRVNGGLNGIDDRIKKTEKYLSWITT